MDKKRLRFIVYWETGVFMQVGYRALVVWLDVVARRLDERWLVEEIRF